MPAAALDDGRNVSSVKRKDSPQVRDIESAGSGRASLEGMAPQKVMIFREAVRRRWNSGERDQALRFDGEDATGSGAGGEQREDPAPGADVEHNRAGLDNLLERARRGVHPQAIVDHRNVVMDAVLGHRGYLRSILPRSPRHVK